MTETYTRMMTRTDEGKFNFKLFEIISFIALGISAWALITIIQLKTDFASLKASLPSKYPPEWFQDEYKRDQAEKLARLDRIDATLMENNGLLIKAIAELETLKKKPL